MGNLFGLLGGLGEDEQEKVDLIIKEVTNLFYFVSTIENLEKR